MVLRNLFSPMELYAKHPEIGKPYYLTYTSIIALAITEPSPSYKITGNRSTNFIDVHFKISFNLDARIFVLSFMN